jgi:hypothetical protein
MILHDLLTEAAAGLPGIEARAGADGGTTWSSAGRPFALVHGDGSAEFALDGAVAAAAARTPDVAPSGRGPGWVTFRPTVLDEHAKDRAVAWFVSAHRRLGQG